jgi:hypothetical protein
MKGVLEKTDGLGLDKMVDNADYPGRFVDQRPCGQVWGIVVNLYYFIDPLNRLFCDPCMLSMDHV